MKKIIVILIKYIPILLLLWIIIMLLYRSTILITDETERYIQLWTNGLRLTIIIAMLGSFILQDWFSQLTIRKVPNIIDDFFKKDSADFSVMSNDIVGGVFICTIISVMNILYAITKIHIIFTCSVILSAMYLLGVAISLLSLYIQGRQKTLRTNSAIITNPGIFTMIISLLLIMVTSESIVRIVYDKLFPLRDTVQSILFIIIILCYVLGLTLCYFINLYCLVAYAFIKKDGKAVKEEIEGVLRKNMEREDILRKVTQYVNEKAEDSDGLATCNLMFIFFISLFKSFFLSKLYDVKYLVLLLKLKLINIFNGLWKEMSIRTNVIRFCEIMVVLEFLILDMLLFVYLGSDASCSRFFELLSTVVIIPILLSSLTTLKRQK